nr:PREDICTED: uncharacterized protein CXorf49 homolog [Rhinolophus sinicus]
MSSSDDEGSVWGAGFDPMGGEPPGGREARPTAPRGPRLGLDLGTPQSSEGFASEPEGVEAEGQVLWGREGRPGSPADVQGHVLGYLADEAATAVLQQLTDRDVLGVRRNPSPESCSTEVSTVWVDLDPGPSRRGVRAQSWVGSQPLPSAIAPRHPRGPERGRPWVNPKRGTKNRSNRTVGRHRPSAEGLVGPISDSESSDEIEKMQLMRVTVSRKGRGVARPSSLEGPRDTPRHPSTHGRESFLHVPGPFLSSAARGLTSAVERQAVGEQDTSSSKKMPSVGWGKAESRPSYLGAAAAGGLPAAIPWRKVAQEKRSPGGGSNLVLGRSFPSWVQRVPAPPLEPVTFPTISTVPLLTRSKKSSWAPSGTKQSKHTSAWKKSAARRTRESEPVVEGDKEPKGGPVPRGQPPATKPGPPGVYLYRGDFSSGDFNIGAPVIPRRSQLLALSQGNVLPREPTPSGDQELLDRPPRVERRQELPPGAEGCPRCPVLQREVDELKEQIASMQSLTDKFHSL